MPITKSFSLVENQGGTLGQEKLIVQPYLEQSLWCSQVCWVWTTLRDQQPWETAVGDSQLFQEDIASTDGFLLPLLTQAEQRQKALRNEGQMFFIIPQP